MDILTDQNKSKFNRTAGFLSFVNHKVGMIVRWLVGLFILTDEDRLEAGIYVGAKEPDGSN